MRFMHHIFMAYSMQAQEAAPSDPYPGSSCVCVCVCVCVRTCMCAHVHLLSCIQLFCNPMDCSPQASSVHGILQTKILECLFFSRGSLRPWIETASLVSPALAGRFLTTAPPGKPGSSFPPGCMILEHITISCPHLLNNTHRHTHTHSE